MLEVNRVSNYSIQKEIQKSIIESEKQILSANNLAEKIYSQLEDSKILLRALEQLAKAELTLISLSLKLEYISGNIKLSINPEKNKELFFKISPKTYSLTKTQIKILQRILELGKNYQKSGCTFSQNQKARILNDDGTLDEVSLQTIRSGILVINKLLKSLKSRIIASRKV